MTPHEGWKKAGEEKADIPHLPENVWIFELISDNINKKGWHEQVGSQRYDYSAVAGCSGGAMPGQV